MYDETLETLTKNARTMLKLIRAYKREHGYAPTVRDLRDAMQVSSTGHITYIRNRLALAGLVTFDPYVARSTQLTPKGRRILRAELKRESEASHDRTA